MINSTNEVEFNVNELFNLVICGYRNSNMKFTCYNQKDIKIKINLLSNIRFFEQMRKFSQQSDEIKSILIDKLNIIFKGLSRISISLDKIKINIVITYVNKINGYTKLTYVDNNICCVEEDTKNKTPMNLKLSIRYNRKESLFSLMKIQIHGFRKLIKDFY